MLKAGFASRNQCLVIGNILLLLLVVAAAFVVVAVTEVVVVIERILLNLLPNGEVKRR